MNVGTGCIGEGSGTHKATCWPRCTPTGIPILALDAIRSGIRLQFILVCLSDKLLIDLVIVKDFILFVVAQKDLYVCSEIDKTD